MKHGAAATQSLPKLFLLLLIAFFAIKLLAAGISNVLFRHVCVAFVLFILPFAGSLRTASFFSEILRRPKNNWGYFVCLAYVFTPIFIVGFVYPEQWTAVSIELRNWILSPSGFSAVFIAPLAEEFFFRGWLLNSQLERAQERLTQATNRPAASDAFWVCYFNALCFWILHIPVHAGFFAHWAEALSHGAVPVSPGPFFLGFVAAGLTVLTRTPFAALMIHSLANALGPLWMPLLRDHGLLNYFYQ
jgi:membrane protease YdiL (CAAX protease family)